MVTKILLTGIGKYSEIGLSLIILIHRNMAIRVVVVVFRFGVVARGVCLCVAGSNYWRPREL